MKSFRIITGLVLVLIAGAVLAQTIPQLINYQGRLTDDTGLPIDGTTVSMEFSFWNKEITEEPMINEVVFMIGIFPLPLVGDNLVPGSEVVTGMGGGPLFETPRDYLMDYLNGTITRVATGFIPNGIPVEVDYDWTSYGNRLWNETQSSVNVTEGIYNVILGSTNPIPSSAFSNITVYLEVGVEGETLAPRSRLTSVPFAYKAATVPNNAIGTSQLANDAVTSAKISDGTIAGSDIDSQTITSSNIADGTITSTQIQDLSIAGSDLQNDSLGATQIQDIYALNTGDTVTGTLYMYGSPYGTYAAWSGDPDDHYAYFGDQSYGVYTISGASDETESRFGGYFRAATQSTAYGVDGRAYGYGSSTVTGVRGYGSNSTNGMAFGGAFYTAPEGTGSHYGVATWAYGNSASPAYGTYSSAQNDSSGNAYGGYFNTADLGTGIHYGIYAKSRDYSGWFQDGRVHVGDGGTEDYVDGDGDHYVEDELEVDGAAYFSGGLDAPGAIDSSDIAPAAVMAANIGEDCDVGEALYRTESGWACGSPWSSYMWTWMGGSDVINQHGVYGTKGTPDPANVPGSRISAVSWTDSSGNMWLFGGAGYPASGDIGYLNDLWRWDGTDWTWMSGSDSVGQNGVYGTKGTPDPANVPGGREKAVSWMGPSGNLWLFGGQGRATSAFGRLNDLWRWDGTNWTWMSGSDLVDQDSVYGTKGTPDPANIPSGRYGAVSWTSSGVMWLFGGYEGALFPAEGWLNDLWRWDGVNWTWMSGGDTVDQNGVYGAMGTPDPANVPGCRYDSVSWADATGNLWLFGGYGYPELGGRGQLNDLWRWDGTNWTWMKGDPFLYANGVYGIKGIPDPGNFPGAREDAVSWKDASGYMWLFGGAGYPAIGSAGYLNDLLKWDGTNWTWMSGGDIVNRNGIYGTMGTPYLYNVPGARGDAVSWTDSSGNFWLFGGEGYPASGGTGYLNDLWRYKP